MNDIFPLPHGTNMPWSDMGDIHHPPGPHGDRYRPTFQYIGRYCNEGREQGMLNCEMVEDNGFKVLKALKDVPQDDELFWDYGTADGTHE